MAPSKYPAELRERATRLCVEARQDPALRNGAIARIADQTGVSSEALRVWVRKAEAEGLPVETRMPRHGSSSWRKRTGNCVVPTKS